MGGLSRGTGTAARRQALIAEANCEKPSSIAAPAIARPAGRLRIFEDWGAGSSQVPYTSG